MLSCCEEQMSGDGAVASRRRGNLLFIMWLLFTSIDCTCCHTTTNNTTNSKGAEGQKDTSAILKPTSWTKTYPDLIAIDKDGGNRKDGTENAFPLKSLTQSNANRDKRSESPQTIIHPNNRLARNGGPLNKNFLRFGRSGLDRNFLRFGRGSGLSGNFLRYGRRNMLSKNFLRFGRDGIGMSDDDNNDCNKDGDCWASTLSQTTPAADDQPIADDNSSVVKRGSFYLFRGSYQPRPMNRNSANGKRGGSKLDRNFVRFGKRSRMERLNAGEESHVY